MRGVENCDGWQNGRESVTLEQVALLEEVAVDSVLSGAFLYNLDKDVAAGRILPVSEPSLTKCERECQSGLYSEGPRVLVFRAHVFSLPPKKDGEQMATRHLGADPLGGAIANSCRHATQDTAGTAGCHVSGTKNRSSTRRVS